MVGLEAQESKQTIALCMIVKNESKVIERALNSVNDIVDYVCICDTGSSDGTQNIIWKYLEDNNLSGTVYNRPWVNFSHNRTECFDYAKGKCDYMLTLDADEVIAPYLDGKPALTHKVDGVPELTDDIIYITTSFGENRYLRAGFFKDGLAWKWHQPVHEYPHAEDQESESIAQGICTYVTQEGFRSEDANKYRRDALIFEQWVLDHPEDGRAWFYMTQSYADSGNVARALEIIDTAIKYTTWPQELYILHLRKARYKRRMGLPFSDVVGDYINAYNMLPHRAEAICALLKGYKDTDSFQAMILLGERALKTLAPDESDLFYETGSYTWELKDLMSIAYYYGGEREKAKALIEDLLIEAKAPEDQLTRIKQNYEYF
jgi:glycosyltransferase involved in cell wall biosynthesis